MPEFQQFNLNDDPGEQINVIADHLNVADRMKAQQQKLIAIGRSR